MISPAIAIVATVLTVLQQPTPPGAQPAMLSATAVRAERAPIIDGSDADAVWQRAPRYTGFRQFQPKVDVEPKNAQ